MLKQVTFFNSSISQLGSAWQSVARLRSFVTHFFVTCIETLWCNMTFFRGMVRRFCFALARGDPTFSAYEKAAMPL